MKDTKANSRQKLTKDLKLSNHSNSDNKPEWMILHRYPARFKTNACLSTAVSLLVTNDLYRRHFS